MPLAAVARVARHRVERSTDAGGTISRRSIRPRRPRRGRTAVAVESSKDASSSSKTSPDDASRRDGARKTSSVYPEDVSDAFDRAVSEEGRRSIVEVTNVDELRERARAERKQLAATELALAAAVLARKQESFDSMDEFCSYGYIASVKGVYIDVSRNEVPKGFAQTASENFAREMREMVAFIDPDLDESDGRTTMPKELRVKLEALRLDSDAIWEREKNRPEVPAPWLLKAPYLALCFMLDKLFDETKPVQRFWFLETVARMPYYSYTAALTFYEILGWYRGGAELRKIHFAEEWNEYHHLLIMESLGGDVSWRDRFLGQHAALVYYGVLILLWFMSPALAYNFSELIEAHAVDTYAQFVDQNAELLKTMPAPRIAVEYYEGADLYLFDEFQTAREVRTRRPRIRTLYDVFSNIRDDEGEHVSTMNACQKEDAAVSSPNSVNAKTAAISALITAQYVFTRFAEIRGGLGGELLDDLLVDDAILDDANAGILDAILRAVDALFL